MTEQEYKEWKEHPVTKWVLETLLMDRQAAMELWASGQMPESEQKDWQAQCRVYQDLSELDYETLSEIRAR